MFETSQEEGNTRSPVHRITDAGACVLRSGISAHAAVFGNENGSFFSPLPAYQEPVIPLRKGRRVSREARGRSRQMAWLFGFVFERRAEASADRGQQPRARRGSSARRRARASVRVAEIGSAVVAQRSTARASCPLRRTGAQCRVGGGSARGEHPRKVSQGIGHGASGEMTTDTSDPPN